MSGYPGPRPGARFERAIRAGQRAGVVLFKRNIDSLEELAKTCGEMHGWSDLGVVIAVDQEGGRVARLGPPVLQIRPVLGLSAVSPETIRRAAKLVSEEMRALGITMNAAPVLDVHSREENPVIGDRSFGKNPEAVIRGALAFARGIRDGGIIACGKHFPGHGDTRTDSHFDLPVVDGDRARLDAIELAPFRAAIEDGIPSIMTAHVVYPALDDKPATLSHKIATDLLRGEFGFRGVLVSDDIEMRAIADRYGYGEAAVLAIEAGCDLLLVCSDENAQEAAYEALVKRAEASATFRERALEAAARVQKIKIAARPDFSRFRALCESDDARALAREVG